MGLSIVLANLLERWRPRRRPSVEQLRLLRQAMSQAYQLAYYILGDQGMARKVALRALVGLTHDYRLLKHRVTNQASYRHGVWLETQTPSKIRKVTLPFDLQMAARVFSITIPYERGRRHTASLADYDVSFCKCALLVGLQGSNALWALIAIGNGVHSYTRQEITGIFYELIQAVPRNQESWNAGNEPFGSYLKKLNRAILGEFSGYVRTDANGQIIKRPRAEQPVDLIAECINTLTLQETGDSCLGETVQSSFIRAADIESELKRIHMVLHLPCFTGLTEAATQQLPREKAGMPEYTNMLENNNGKNRQAPPLSDEGLNSMVEEFQQLLERRRHAPTSIVITVDGSEQNAKSVQLDETGHTELRLQENSKLIEIWARSEGEADILLSAFFLSLDSARETVTLEGGQEITLTADYAESDDGAGSFQVGIGYGETKFTRKILRSYRRKTHEQIKRPRYTQPAFLVVLALAFFTAVVVLVPQIRNRVYVASKSIFSSFTASPSPIPTDQNNVTVQTNPHGTPTAHFTMSAQGKTATDGQTLTLSVPVNGNVTVAFASTSVKGSAAITSYVWRSNGTQICGNSSTCSYNFGTASNKITLTVTDSNGLNSIATIGQTEAERRFIPNGQDAVRQDAFAAEGRHPPRNNSPRFSKDKSVKGVVPSLATIEGVYVESSGLYDTAELNALAHSSQVEALKKSGLFEPKASPDEAEARLKIVSDFESGTGDKAQAQLVTAREGKVIWYGPLLSINRDSNPAAGITELKNFVTKSIQALTAKKEKPVHRRRRNASKVRHPSSAKE
jgi:hypothetical protein